MVTLHNLGFPRIGENRELKSALEQFWRGDSTAESLLYEAASLQLQNWQDQAALDWVPIGDFSLYDHVLDMSVTLGNRPPNGGQTATYELDDYFRTARGRSPNDAAGSCAHAAEMTKWFDTNYHYLVPELSASTSFTLDATRLLSELEQARRLGVQAKPVIIGPVTYLWLGKCKDSGFDRLKLLERLLPVYRQLLQVLASNGAEWVQVDEPVLVTELTPAWKGAIKAAYSGLAGSESVPVRTQAKLMLTTYFGALQENLELVVQLPVAGVHVDVVAGDRAEAFALAERLPTTSVLSLGVVNGRNVWKTDLSSCLDWLEPLHAQMRERLWLAPSCSLLHVPVDLEREIKLEPELKSWLAFARQKLRELQILAEALSSGRSSVQGALEENAHALHSRRRSMGVHQDEERTVTETIERLGNRHSAYSVRAPKQAARLGLPRFPTTTIGSFPQTAEIRRARHRYRKGESDVGDYKQAMKSAIERCIREQEAIGLDVLVHGEPERNDMVEYFGENLEGFALTQYGWVQSYGSRCVKPPVLFGNAKRPRPITVEWTQYAQSLTRKPVKGMLTGPVTLLNWSFVRDDQPPERTCIQLALAVRQEVLDLEAAGVAIIQIDEAALREGLPLRRAQWDDYLRWAVGAFRIAAGGVKDETQIHSHMCYSEFNEIIGAIAKLDADVITIETARSGMELLSAFEDFNYPNQFGPGVYDIHSPNVPSEAAMIELMRSAVERIPSERLWVNPDCGLKTRQWQEVLPALTHMVSAAKELRSLQP